MNIDSILANRVGQPATDGGISPTHAPDLVIVNLDAKCPAGVLKAQGDAWLDEHMPLLEGYHETVFAYGDREWKWEWDAELVDEDDDDIEDGLLTNLIWLGAWFRGSVPSEVVDHPQRLNRYLRSLPSGYRFAMRI